MKKNILFVIDSLDCAGAEKSLVTLLSMLDYSIYSVDLMLFSHGGVLENLLPMEVNILEPLKYTTFAKLNYPKALRYTVKELDFKMFTSRIKYSLLIRKRKYKNREKARIFWQCVSGVIEKNPKIYDYAISYAQGTPTFYVAEKVQAMNKYAWVNTSLFLSSKEKNFQKKYYDQFNKIITVSDSAKNIFIETFTEYEHKVEVIYDITNYDFISKMANFDPDFGEDYKGIKILTIGRFDPGKGYDIAIETCMLLKEKGIDFRWYILGKGPQEGEMKKLIKDNGLSEYFILLGVKENPYPYIKAADIYVQTSRFEGFGLAIAEARLLNVPVVTTRFDAVYNQMIDGKNGIVVDMNPKAVCEGILNLINNITFREEIIGNLKNEKKGNAEEIIKFYKLIG
jgi:glycosyltransferase involved in cell wall biosynthesis